jgi:hypothetical protein
VDLGKVPIGRNLIDMPLLSVDERGWVDAYHKEVWEKKAMRGPEHGCVVNARRRCSFGAGHVMIWFSNACAGPHE